MTRDEVKELLMVIQVAYPSCKPQASLEYVVNTWHAMLKDCDSGVAQLALRQYILSDRTGFAPSIGELNGLIQDMSGASGMSVIEAWAAVERALRNGRTNYQAEFAKLPEGAKRAIGDAGTLRSWALADEGYVQTVCRRDFVRSYEKISQIMPLAANKNEIEEKPQAQIPAKDWGYRDTAKKYHSPVADQAYEKVRQALTR